MYRVVFVISCVFFSLVASGCGYLDEEIAMSDEEFEESFGSISMGGVGGGSWGCGGGYGSYRHGIRRYDLAAMSISLGGVRTSSTDTPVAGGGEVEGLPGADQPRDVDATPGAGGIEAAYFEIRTRRAEAVGDFVNNTDAR